MTWKIRDLLLSDYGIDVGVRRESTAPCIDDHRYYHPERCTHDTPLRCPALLWRNCRERRRELLKGKWSDSRTNGRRSIETDVRCAECGRYLTARTVRRGMTICWACYKRRLGKRPYKKKGGEGSKSSSKAGPPRP